MKKILEWGRGSIVLFFLGLTFLVPPTADAFWLLGFSTADTQPAGTASFIGGTGGQLTNVTSSAGDHWSYTPYLAHAGIRFGLADGFDFGYRLCTVALPFNVGGPSLGGEVDFKWRLSSPGEPWRLALGAGFANAFLDNADTVSAAWSPGAFLVVTHALSEGVDLSAQSRYVYTWIERPNGAGTNDLTAIGESLGLKIDLSKGLSIRPEIGAFRFLGSIGGQSAQGWGWQYGTVIGARIW